MTQVKNNQGRDDLPSLRYIIESAEIATRKGIAVTAKFTFTGTSERSVADILRDGGQTDDERSERDAAAEWLTGYLTAHDGEAKAAEIFKAAKKDELSERTVQRARTRAGITSVRTGFGEGSTWTLPAPVHDTIRAVHDRLSNPGANGANVASMEPPGAHDCGHLVIRALNGKCPICLAERANAEASQHKRCQDCQTVLLPDGLCLTCAEGHPDAVA